MRNGNVPGKVICQQFLPLTFNNNWYVTCYILIYMLHPILNLIIEKTSKRTFFRLVMTTSWLYLVSSFFLGMHFFSSIIIIWITIYFLLAYLKKYMVKIMNNKRVNKFMFITSVTCNIMTLFFMNLIGLKFPMMGDKLMHFSGISNPLTVISAISLFNILRLHCFQIEIINSISSLALYVYLIHENTLLRSYYRTAFWDLIYRKIGYSHLLLLVLGMVLVIFLFGLILGYIYKKTCGRINEIIVQNLLPVIKDKYNCIEGKILSI